LILLILISHYFAHLFDFSQSTSKTRVYTHASFTEIIVLSF